MPSNLFCRVVSATECLFEGEVESLTAMGIDGELGILPRHLPLITLLKPGPLRLVSEGSEEVLYVSGGVLEVQPHLVTVLADSAQRAATLDEASIKKARQDAQNALQNQKDEMQIAQALDALAQTSARLNALQKYKRKTR